MHIVICDDSVADLCYVKQVLLSYSEQRNVHFQVSAYSSAQELLKVLEQKNNIDLLILDVVMPSMTGIDLGKALRVKGNAIDIIYTTTIKDYAFDAFKIQARDYLLKPVDDNLLFSALDKFFHEKETASDVVLVSRDCVCNLKFSDIVYCESRGQNVVWSLLKGDSLLVKEDFENAKARLSKCDSFYQLGKTCIVNFDYVDVITDSEILLKTGTKIVIPKKKGSEVKQVYLSFQMLRR